MATATPDHTQPTKEAKDESYISRLNSAVGIDDQQPEINRNEINYFYSSGNFHFILEKGFKPETLEMTELTNVPFLPDWHAGIISIHGIIMPVIDILKFAKTQHVEIKKKNLNKHFLLKLEHAEHSPIVLILDALPQPIDTENLKKSDAKNKSPAWIKHYLEDKTTKLALIDHNKLFDQIINSQ